MRLEGHQGGVFGVDLDQESRTAFTASGDKVTSHCVYMYICSVCVRSPHLLYWYTTCGTLNLSTIYQYMASYGFC